MNSLWDFSELISKANGIANRSIDLLYHFQNRFAYVAAMPRLRTFGEVYLDAEASSSATVSDAEFDSTNANIILDKESASSCSSSSSTDDDGRSCVPLVRSGKSANGPNVPAVRPVPFLGTFVSALLIRARRVLPYGSPPQALVVRQAQVVLGDKIGVRQQRALDNRKEFRKLAGRVVEHRSFDLVIVALVVLNTCGLAFAPPPGIIEQRMADADAKGEEYSAKGWEVALQVFDVFVLVVFTAECLLKICAYGAWSEVRGINGYFKSWWNYVDFGVVIVGYVSLLPSVGSFAALRSFRILRVFSSVSHIEGLRISVNSIFVSMRELKHVASLMLMFVIFFSVIGLQLFAGVLRQRCTTAEFADGNLTLGTPSVNNDELAICSTSSSRTVWGMCPYPLPSLVESTLVDYNASLTTCATVGENPNFGFTGFDNIGQSLFTTLQLLTLDEWEYPYQYVRQATLEWSAVFFLFLVWFGSLFVLVLIVAIVADSYQRAVDAAKVPTASTAGLIVEVGLSIGLGLGTGVDLSAARVIEEAQVSHSAAEDLLPGLGAGITLSTRDKSKFGAQDNGEESLVERMHRAASSTSRTRPLSVPSFLVDSSSSLWSRVRLYSFVITDWRPPGTSRMFANQDRTPYFFRFILVCIIFNVVTLAVRYPFMPSWLRTTTDVLNVSFSIIFVFEMIIRLLAQGFEEYLSDKLNWLDATIALIGLVDVIILFSTSNTSVVGVNVFMAFRLLRLFKLLRQWKSLRLISNALLSSAQQYGNLVIILLVVCVMFAIIGMQLFGGRYGRTDIPRTNFDDFGTALLSVFRIMVGEWTEPAFDGMRFTHPTAALYFIMVLAIGNYLVLNLFLALLLSTFGEIREQKEQQQKEKKMLKHALKAQLRREEEMRAPLAARPKMRRSRMSSHGMHEDDKLGTNIEMQVETKTESLDEEGSSETIGSSSVSDDENNATANDGEHKSKTQLAEIRPWVLEGKSFFYFPSDHVLRVWLCSKLQSRAFETCMLIIVLASSLTLAVEDPHALAGSGSTKTFFALDIMFAVLFVIELLLKSFTLGFVFESRETYLRNPWNAVDFVTTVLSVVAVIVELAAGGSDASRTLTSIRVVRTLRSLRALRVIRFGTGMRRVVDALLYSLPPIANVVVVASLLWVLFGILGVSLLGGEFFSCQLTRSGELSEILRADMIDALVVTKNDCEQLALGNFTGVPGANATGPSGLVDWINAPASFDHLPAALFSLLQLATLEGWQELMYSGIDGVGIDKQPVRDHNPWIALYFVAFIFIGSFVILNLFIGVIVDTFSELTKRTKGLFLLSSGQRQWVVAHRHILRAAPRSPPPRPQASSLFGRLRSFCYSIWIWPFFDRVMFAAVVGNIFILSLWHFEIEKDRLFFNIVEGLNVAFAILYVFEASLKLMAIGRGYFEDKWNWFDFLVSVVGVVDLLVFFAISSSASDDARRLAAVIRVLRLIRFIRIAKQFAGVKKLLFTLVMSAPSLFNVLVILAVFEFIFAIAGMQLFSRIKFGEFFNESANFNSFGNALLILLRLSTAAGWNEVASDIMFAKQPCGGDYCDPTSPLYLNTLNCECGSPFVGASYLSLLLLVIFQLILNLYTAVVLENFEAVSRQAREGVSKKCVRAFARIWRAYDPQCTGWISVSSVHDVLRTAPPPLGLGPRAAPLDTLRLLRRLNVKTSHNRLNYFALVSALVRNVLGVETLPPNLQKKLQWRKQAFKFAGGIDLDEQSSVFDIGATEYSAAVRAHHEYAARVIWSFYQRYLARRRANAEIVLREAKKPLARGLTDWKSGTARLRVQPLSGSSLSSSLSQSPSSGEDDSSNSSLA